MNNIPLVRFLKDARSGKVRRLDRDVLDFYGLPEDVLRISNDELCERLIIEHERYQQLRLLANQHMEKMRLKLITRQTQHQSELTHLQSAKATLQQGHLRWHHFLLGWSCGAVLLLLLSLLGPELNDFAAGWILSLGSLLMAPKLKAAYRFLKSALRIVHRLSNLTDSSRKAG